MMKQNVMYQNIWLYSTNDAYTNFLPRLLLFDVLKHCFCFISNFIGFCCISGKKEKATVFQVFVNSNVNIVCGIRLFNRKTDVQQLRIEMLYQVFMHVFHKVFGPLAELVDSRMIKLKFTHRHLQLFRDEEMTPEVYAFVDCFKNVILHKDLFYPVVLMTFLSLL